MHDAPKPPSDREALRTRVHARAKQLRFRRRLRISAALLSTAAVIATLAGVALLPDAPTDDVRDVAAEPTTTVDPTASPEPTPSPTTEPTPDTSPTPLVCRNSTNPDCGPFRWDPAPEPNRPMTVDVEIEPPEPTAGDEVTFTLTITDDSPQPAWFVEGSFGHGELPDVVFGEPCKVTTTAYGPWTPPRPKKTVTVDRVSHIYDEAGTFHVWLHSANYNCHSSGQPHPFGSEKTARFDLVVAPAATPTPAL